MVLRLTFATLLLVPQTPLLAHHSLAAEFDASRPVILRGTVTKVSWTNPHVFVWVDVAGLDGKFTNWTVESAAPIYLERLGWVRHSLKVGDNVTIRAYPAKDQPNVAKTDAVDLPGGRRVTTGRADDGARDAGSH